MIVTGKTYAVSSVCMLPQNLWSEKRNFADYFIDSVVYGGLTEALQPAWEKLEYKSNHFSLCFPGLLMG